MKGMFREVSGKVQERFREGSVKVQGMIKDGSGKFPETFLIFLNFSTEQLTRTS